MTDTITKRAPGAADSPSDVTSTLPTLRTMWAFSNGVYTARDNRFWALNCRDDDCPIGKFAPAKRFDVNFPVALLNRPLVDIAVPGIDTIIGTQQFTEGQQTWLWIALGRALFAANEFESWHVAPFFTGAAGTGKSVLIELMTSVVYNQSDTYLLPNAELSSTAAAFDEAMQRAFLIAMPDVRDERSIGMSKAQLDAILKQKGGPTMMFASNSAPPTLMDGVALPIAFTKPVSEAQRDGTLLAQCSQHIGAFILKAARAYVTTVAMYRHRDNNDVRQRMMKDVRSTS